MFAKKNWNGTGVQISVAILLRLAVCMAGLYYLSTLAHQPTGIIHSIDAKLAELWERYIVDHSFEYVFIVGTALLLLACNVIPPLIFTIIDLMATDAMQKYRVQWNEDQPRKYPTWAECVVCIRQSAFLYISTIMPLVILGAPVFKFRGFTHLMPLPSIVEAFLFIPFFMLCEDIPGYLIHRCMHMPWLFKHVHGVHHRLNSPWALADLYMHPGEVLVMGMPRVVGSLVLGGARVHLFTHWTWLAYITINSYYDHSGYDFWFDPRRYLGVGGPRMHDAHHKFMKGSFGFNFKILDQLLGTYTPQTLEEYAQYKGLGGKDGFLLQGMSQKDFGVNDGDIGVKAVFKTL